MVYLFLEQDKMMLYGLVTSFRQKLTEINRLDSIQRLIGWYP